MSEASLSQVLEACTQRCREMDAPLGDRLQSFADDVRRLDPVFAEVVDRMVAHLLRVEAGAGAPNIGEPFPSFVLPDENGHLVSLEGLLRSGPAVIAFHRGHWCPYCRINAETLARIEPELKRAGAHLVIITPETQHFTRELKADAKATFPILTDLDCGYALDLGVAFKVPEEKRAAMTSAGFDISGFNDNSNWTLPIPATFVVGDDGLVKARYVDPDYRHRMDIQEILRAARS
ncbi:MAG: AhpC/TSA family protein [Hyphomicrobiaceae bacterium]|nr:AhpC/TSA family protein [Hyphomicrobiaceae bacterium]MCC0008677.1 AhpC/TSA family protein [Hyphomicrobiaceae bacterium]